MGGWEKDTRRFTIQYLQLVLVGKNAADALWNIQWNVSALFCLPAFALPVPRFGCYLLLLLLFFPILLVS